MGSGNVVMEFLEGYLGRGALRGRVPSRSYHADRYYTMFVKTLAVTVELFKIHTLCVTSISSHPSSQLVALPHYSVRFVRVPLHYVYQAIMEEEGFTRLDLTEYSYNHQRSCAMAYSRYSRRRICVLHEEVTDVFFMSILSRSSVLSGVVVEASW